MASKSTEGINEDGVITFTPDRLIQEPIVFLGFTDSEVVKGGLISGLLCIPTTVLLLLPFGYALLGIGLGMGLAVLMMFIIGKKLTVLKRKYPDGLHEIYIKQQLQHRTSLNYQYIDYEGEWGIRRGMQINKLQNMEQDDLSDNHFDYNHDLSEITSQSDANELKGEEK